MYLLQGVAEERLAELQLLLECSVATQSLVNS